MTIYRKHIALIRSLYRGVDAFVEELRSFTEIDDEAFLCFLRDHRLRPWLNPVVENEEASRTLPGGVLKHLQVHAPRSRARVDRLISQAGELRDGLAEREIDALFFKGIILGTEVYRDPYRRHQSDVDLMVDRSDLRAAVHLLGTLGYNTEFDSSSGHPLDFRIARILKKPFAAKTYAACSLKRDDETVDLHCCLRVRYETSIDFRALHGTSREIEVSGSIYSGPSQENGLLILLLVMADDLRRSACRAKLFLDLHMSLHALEPDWSWDHFFAARREERLEKLVVNVFALFLELWDCALEFPQLSDAITRRSALVEIANSADADAIIARPRKHPANRLLHRRIYTAAKFGDIARRCATDLPHSAARMAGLRRTLLNFPSA